MAYGATKSQRWLAYPPRACRIDVADQHLVPGFEVTNALHSVRPAQQISFPALEWPAEIYSKMDLLMWADSLLLTGTCHTIAAFGLQEWFLASAIVKSRSWTAWHERVPEIDNSTTASQHQEPCNRITQLSHALLGSTAHEEAVASPWTKAFDSAGSKPHATGWSLNAQACHWSRTPRCLELPRVSCSWQWQITAARAGPKSSAGKRRLSGFSKSRAWEASIELI